MKKIYLAGPDVFLKDAVSIGNMKKNACKTFGFEGLFPFDNEVDFTESDPDTKIFKCNIEMIRSADMGIFNLTPFRGPSADVGTVFELGMMYGLGKPCYGYTNVYGDYLARIYEKYNGRYDPYNKIFKDKDDMMIENFGNLENLMIDHSLDIFIAPSCHGVDLGEQRRIGKSDRFEKVLTYIHKQEKLNAK